MQIMPLYECIELRCKRSNASKVQLYAEARIDLLVQRPGVPVERNKQRCVGSANDNGFLLHAG